MADDEKFLKINRDITRQLFVLYSLDDDSDIVSRSPAERERVKSFAQLAREEPEDQDQIIAKEVAKKLRRVGDQLDLRLKGKMKEAMEDLFAKQSVWEIGYSQFSSTCSGILSSCQNHVKSGWEQVSVVYITAVELITELSCQQTEVGQRQQQMENFTGKYLSDSGLEEWAEDKGGIENLSDEPTDYTKVHISDDI